MAKLSRSVDEFLAAGGWSASLFIEHAKLAFTELKGKAIVDVGRSVIHLMTHSAIIKCYVHRGGLDREWMTITDKKGLQIQSFHCTTEPSVVLARLKELLQITK